MTRRAHLRPQLREAADPAEADASGIRRSVRVGTAARDLDIDERDVRQLLKDGALEGHMKGKRGVRVYVDSIAAWQGARPRGGAAETAPARAAARSAPQSPSFREALAYLARNGIA